MWLQGIEDSSHHIVLEFWSLLCMPEKCLCLVQYWGCQRQQLFLEVHFPSSGLLPLLFLIVFVQCFLLKLYLKGIEEKLPFEINVFNLFSLEKFPLMWYSNVVTYTGSLNFSGPGEG